MLLSAVRAIVNIENFGPDSENSEAMPSIQDISKSTMKLNRSCIRLGPGPLWCS